MKHKGMVTIHKSREVVTAMFINPEYNHEYQDGFIRKELVSGLAGQDGAVSNMYYKYGKRDMILTETIVRNNLPHTFEAFYHHQHMDNTMKCTFSEIDTNKTEYHYEYEYTRMDWFMPKLMAILFPSVYKKQGDKWMRQFKEFVERQ